MIRKRKQNKKELIKKKKGKILNGIVIRASMKDTVVVRVIRKSAHPLYKKMITKRKNYKAHTNKKLKANDKVKIIQSKPFSKDKKWIVLES
jgi:small subunit ribosomal protein S17